MAKAVATAKSCIQYMIAGLEIEQLDSLLDMSCIRAIQQCAHEQVANQSGRVTQLLGDQLVEQRDRPLLGSIYRWEIIACPAAPDSDIAVSALGRISQRRLGSDTLV